MVESIYAFGSATVIVCSAEANLELAVRCMRAGAREFLTLPLNPATIADACLLYTSRPRNGIRVVPVPR